MQRKKLGHRPHPSHESRTNYHRQWKTKCGVFASFFYNPEVEYTTIVFQLCPKCAAVELLEEIAAASPVVEGAP